MKKIICGLSALALMAMPVTAYAEPAIVADPFAPTLNDDFDTWVIQRSNSSVDTLLGYSVDPSFMVTIPASVEFTSAAEETISKDVTVSNVTLPFGSIINVELTNALNKNTDSEFNLVNADDSIPYSVSVGDTEANKAEAVHIEDDIVSFVYDGNYNGIMDTDETEASTATSFTEKLNFTKENSSSAKYAGRYMDSLEFTVSCSYTVTVNHYIYNSDNLFDRVEATIIQYNIGDTWADIIKEKDALKEIELPDPEKQGERFKTVAFASDDAVICRMVEKDGALVPVMEPVELDEELSFAKNYIAAKVSALIPAGPETLDQHPT